MTSLYFFLSTWSGDHRDLHSFPTRRSSDLSRRRSRGRGSRRAADSAVPRNLLRDANRSEEHTSELQSQSNLVCRLLLEKKKSNTTKIVTTLDVFTHLEDNQLFLQEVSRLL